MCRARLRAHRASASAAASALAAFSSSRALLRHDRRSFRPGGGGEQRGEGRRQAVYTVTQGGWWPFEGAGLVVMVGAGLGQQHPAQGTLLNSLLCSNKASRQNRVTSLWTTVRPLHLAAHLLSPP
jgi:hypothetical protein